MWECLNTSVCEHACLICFLNLFHHVFPCKICVYVLAHVHSLSFGCKHAATCAMCEIKMLISLINDQYLQCRTHFLFEIRMSYFKGKWMSCKLSNFNWYMNQFITLLRLIPLKNKQLETLLLFCADFLTPTTSASTKISRISIMTTPTPIPTPDGTLLIMHTEVKNAQVGTLVITQMQPFWCLWEDM